MKVGGLPIMKRKVQASLTFRRNTPGTSIRSIKHMAKYKGQLYTFQYTSWATARKGLQKKNLDAQPLLLLAFREGSKVWKAKNGRKYIYGFNLNYLPPLRRLNVAKSLVKIFKENEGMDFSYKMIKNSLDLPTVKENSIFRKYDVRGGKLRYLKEVSLDKYVAYLEASQLKEK